MAAMLSKPSHPLHSFRTSDRRSRKLRTVWPHTYDRSVNNPSIIVCNRIDRPTTKVITLFINYCNTDIELNKKGSKTSSMILITMIYWFACAGVQMEPHTDNKTLLVYMRYISRFMTNTILDRAGREATAERGKIDDALITLRRARVRASIVSCVSCRWCRLVRVYVGRAGSSDHFLHEHVCLRARRLAYAPKLGSIQLKS